VPAARRVPSSEVPQRRKMKRSGAVRAARSMATSCEEDPA
jgi:hypothetical protein